MKKRLDNTYLVDMRKAAELAVEFLQGISREQFETDIMRQSAVTRQLEIIGEAANHVSEKFQSAHAKIPWSEIIGMRNILIHMYHELDTEIVWKTVHENLPQLLSQLGTIISK